MAVQPGSTTARLLLTRLEGVIVLRCITRKHGQSSALSGYIIAHIRRFVNATLWHYPYIEVDISAGFSRNSVPNNQSVSGKRGHTKNVWLNFLPPKTNNTFTFSSSPVTPYGLIAVTLTSRLDRPCWSIHTFELVSVIKHFSFPSISKATVGGALH